MYIKTKIGCTIAKWLINWFRALVYSVEREAALIERAASAGSYSMSNVHKALCPPWGFLYTHPLTQRRSCAALNSLYYLIVRTHRRPGKCVYTAITSIYIVFISSWEVECSSLWCEQFKIIVYASCNNKAINCSYGRINYWRKTMGVLARGTMNYAALLTWRLVFFYCLSST